MFFFYKGSFEAKPVVAACRVPRSELANNKISLFLGEGAFFFFQGSFQAKPVVAACPRPLSEHVSK